MDTYTDKDRLCRPQTRSKTKSKDRSSTQCVNYTSQEFFPNDEKSRIAPPRVLFWFVSSRSEIAAISRWSVSSSSWSTAISWKQYVYLRIIHATSGSAVSRASAITSRRVQHVHSNMIPQTRTRRHRTSSGSSHREPQHEDCFVVVQSQLQLYICVSSPGSCCWGLLVHRPSYHHDWSCALQCYSSWRAFDVQESRRPSAWLLLTHKHPLTSRCIQTKSKSPLSVKTQLRIKVVHAGYACPLSHGCIHILLVWRSRSLPSSLVTWRTRRCTGESPSPNLCAESTSVSFPDAENVFVRFGIKLSRTASHDSVSFCRWSSILTFPSSDDMLHETSRLSLRYVILTEPSRYNLTWSTFKCSSTRCSFGTRVCLLSVSSSDPCHEEAFQHDWRQLQWCSFPELHQKWRPWCWMWCSSGQRSQIWGRRSSPASVESVAVSPVIQAQDCHPHVSSKLHVAHPTKRYWTRKWSDESECLSTCCSCPFDGAYLLAYNASWISSTNPGSIVILVSSLRDADLLFNPIKTCWHKTLPVAVEETAYLIIRSPDVSAGGSSR